jgi:hypothetical protein
VRIATMHSPASCSQPCRLLSSDERNRELLWRGDIAHNTRHRHVWSHRLGGTCVYMNRIVMRCVAPFGTLEPPTVPHKAVRLFLSWELSPFQSALQKLHSAFPTATSSGRVSGHMHPDQCTARAPHSHPSHQHPTRALSDVDSISHRCTRPALCVLACLATLLPSLPGARTQLIEHECKWGTISGSWATVPLRS